MSIAFTVNIDKSDWRDQLSGWQCSPLAIPGAEVVSLYTQEARIDKAWYEIPEGLNTIRWVHGTPAPERATVAIKLNEELSTQELTAKWKKLAIVLPVVATLFVGIVAALVKPRPDPSPSSVNDWTIKGTVQKSNDFLYSDVETYVMPPDLRLKQDYTFEGKLPIETLSNGYLALPNVILVMKEKKGFEPQVVHLTNPGEKLPINAEDYNLDINAMNKIIDIRKPIIFQRDTTPYPYSQTEIRNPK
jgi:hypothetical protein